MIKKVLIVDDSALMRRVFCDIISADERFCIADEAEDGQEALQLILEKEYDVVVLDVNMPKMTGIELLRELRKRRILPRVMMASIYTKEGARVTMEALECGALDFINIPSDTSVTRTKRFAEKFMEILNAVAEGNTKQNEIVLKTEKKAPEIQVEEMPPADTKQQIVAIASSTGGPQALKALLPLIPGTLNAPIVIVQHMPQGFTKTLSERLDNESQLTVKEAEEGEILHNGCAYVAPGGKHMMVGSTGGMRHTIKLSDLPPRENVKPCANYLFESLADKNFDEVICVVLTGMGSDGTEGILNLQRKQTVRVMVQSPDTCVVNGMPGSVTKAEIACQVLDLDEIAKEIIKNVGVK